MFQTTNQKEDWKYTKVLFWEMSPAKLLSCSTLPMALFVYQAAPNGSESIGKAPHKCSETM